jgi:hypothetical protein
MARWPRSESSGSTLARRWKGKSGGNRLPARRLTARRFALAISGSLPGDGRLTLVETPARRIVQNG